MTPSSNEGAGLFLLSALIAIAYFAVSALFLTRRKRWYEREARLERTRSYWAQARFHLFNLVRAEKLNPRSATFTEFYQLQTQILRHPEAYEFISMQLQHGGLVGDHEGEQEPAWLRERHSWPKEMSVVLHTMYQGLAALAACYRPEGESAKALQRQMQGFSSHREARVVSGSRPTRPIRVVLQEAQKEVNDLERFAAAQPSAGFGPGAGGPWSPSFQP